MLMTVAILATLGIGVGIAVTSYSGAGLAAGCAMIGLGSAVGLWAIFSSRDMMLRGRYYSRRTQRVTLAGGLLVPIGLGVMAVGVKYFTSAPIAFGGMTVAGLGAVSMLITTAVYFVRQFGDEYLGDRSKS